MRAKAQIDKKGSDLQPSDMARHLGAHLCRCTGYVKILEAIDAVAKGKQFEPALAATVGGSGAKYEAGELALGDRDYVDDMRVPGMLHAALHLTAHSRAEILSFDTTAAAAAPGVVAVFTAADIPGELRVGHHPQGLAGDDSHRRTHQLRRRRAGDRRRRNESASACRSRAGRGRLRRADSGHRSRGRVGRGCADRGLGYRQQRAQRQRVLTRRRRRRARNCCSHSARDVPHATYRARVPGTGEHTRRAVDGRWCQASAGVFRRPRRVGRSQRHRQDALRRQRSGHRDIGVERRCVRRQGRHEQPAACLTCGVAARSTGQVHAVARGEPAHPPQATSDHASSIGPGATPMVI